jgi:hypothetical protein
MVLSIFVMVDGLGLGLDLANPAEWAQDSSGVFILTF